MAKLIFWTSFAFVFYVYFGYPLLLVAWHRLMRWPVCKAYLEPRVSLVIAAYNEKENIGAKISNCLRLDYPRDRLQIIVSLDGPTDGTEAVVRQYDGIEIVYSPEHRGKSAALNRAVAVARGDILVFADARQRFDPQAVRELVANFSDSSVGAVTGELILLDQEGQEAKDGVGLYWRYEKWLRAMESDIHSVLGATGAIYATRRELFRELPEDTILDDMAIPLQIVLSGKRSVFEQAAPAYDHVDSSEVEYGRKVRTLTGNYQLVTRMPELLIPGRNPVFFQFVSHKLGRLLVPYFLAALFFSNLFLLEGLYLAFFACQAAWYSLAVAGIVLNTGGGLDQVHPALPAKRDQKEV